MPLTTLDRLKPGQVATIRKIQGKGAIRRRIMEMGLTNGAKVEMVKTSPLGDPIEYKVRGYSISLRKAEAQTIEVEM